MNTAAIVFTSLGGLSAVLGFVFVVLRYVIRAETSELRNNGGSTIKDKVDRIDQAAKDAKIAAEVAAKKAEEAAGVASETKVALDAHVAQSAKLIDQGTRDKNAIEARQAKQDQTIATLAHAVDIAAQSTPPE
jgi:hypothetical protein